MHILRLFDSEKQLFSFYTSMRARDFPKNNFELNSDVQKRKVVLSNNFSPVFEQQPNDIQECWRNPAFDREA